MKKVVFISLLMLQIVACEKIEYSPFIKVIPLEVIDDGSYDLVLDCNAQTSSFAINANCAWIVEVNSDATSWLTVAPPYEKKPGRDTIIFSITQNETEAERQGKITFYASDTTVVFTVTQTLCTSESEENKSGIPPMNL